VSGALHAGGGRFDVRFGSKAAVDNASFSIAPGGFVGVIRPFGAGKSTLLRMITPRRTRPRDDPVRSPGRDGAARQELRQWRARSAMIPAIQSGLPPECDQRSDGTARGNPVLALLTQFWPEEDSAGNACP